MYYSYWIKPSCGFREFDVMAYSCGHEYTSMNHVDYIDYRHIMSTTFPKLHIHERYDAQMAPLTVTLVHTTGRFH